MPVGIIDRGRGPEIEGTRITVYDIWDYAKDNWHRDAIAATLRLSSSQVSAALEYIEDHKDKVLSEYEGILERERRGNPSGLQAKLDSIHERWQAKLAERSPQYVVKTDDQNPG
ncbi:MAG: DUF433 domain-containing protein [Pirellulaceae bacterium]|nr:DUF433 domain-containing protein [Pirellulaceae bacterium]